MFCELLNTIRIVRLPKKTYDVFEEISNEKVSIERVFLFPFKFGEVRWLKLLCDEKLLLDLFVKLVLLVLQ